MKNAEKVKLNPKSKPFTGRTTKELGKKDGD